MNRKKSVFFWLTTQIPIVRWQGRSSFEVVLCHHLDQEFRDSKWEKEKLSSDGANGLLFAWVLSERKIIRRVRIGQSSFRERKTTEEVEIGYDKKWIPGASLLSVIGFDSKENEHRGRWWAMMAQQNDMEMMGGILQFPWILVSSKHRFKYPLKWESFMFCLVHLMLRPFNSRIWSIGVKKWVRGYIGAHI